MSCFSSQHLGPKKALPLRSTMQSAAMRRAPGHYEHCCAIANRWG